jgi:hypothetical protein
MFQLMLHSNFNYSLIAMHMLFASGYYFTKVSINQNKENFGLDLVFPVWFPGFMHRPTRRNQSLYAN